MASCRLFFSKTCQLISLVCIPPIFLVLYSLNSWRLLFRCTPKVMTKNDFLVSSGCFCQLGLFANNFRLMQLSFLISVHLIFASRGSVNKALTKSFTWLVCRVAGLHKQTRHANDFVNAKSLAREKPSARRVI